MENTEIHAYLQPFYASFGFKTFSDEYLEDGIPHIDMILENKR
ncbi:GNAT family N-acetyltransferase [Streptococcus gallolyticus]